jgi:NAD(P)-dependent dehydrogenase (short-subunit alcohol dehydrogenase family)
MGIFIMNRLGRAALAAAIGIGAFMLTKMAIRNKRKIGLKDKNVFLTGGSRGLGLEMARQLVEEGARLAICARDENELETARKQLAALGGVVLAVKCDVTKEEQVNEAIRQTRQHLGPIDILINNAGMIVEGPLEEMGIKEYKDTMDTHFWGPLYTMRAVEDEMRARGEGRIVNISSIAGKISLPHQVPYSASKAALVGLSEGYREELLKDNVYVTTVCPSLIRSGGHKNAEIKGKHEKEYEWFSALDTNRITAMNAENTAKRIINALRYGDPEVILSGNGKLAVVLQGLLPGLLPDQLGVVNQFLPKATKDRKAERRKGRDIDQAKGSKFITSTGDRAAVHNNEFSNE